MASSFPSSLDAFTNPSSADAMDSVSVPHATQHADLNDAVVALEAKVGADSSAVSSSHDYKIAQLEGRDTAGLVHISRTTIGSAVSSVTVSGAFSSTYDNYRIVVTGGTPSNTTDMWLKLGATTTGYYFGGKARFYAGSDADKNAQNFARWFVGTNGASNSMGLDVMVMGPNLATETTYFTQVRGVYTTGAGGAVGGFLDDSTQYTSFIIEPTVGTLTGGTIDVYGYAKA